MKFTDGIWQIRPGVSAQYAAQAYDVLAGERDLTISAPTTVINQRGATLNRRLLTVRLTSPLPGVVGVRIENHRGVPADEGFDLIGASQDHPVQVHVDDEAGVLTSGELEVRVKQGESWEVTFSSGDQVLTRLGHKSIGSFDLQAANAVVREPVGETGATPTGRAAEGHYLGAQLDLGVGTLVYGLGERFGPLIKNGQTVDIWNSDGGTASEQAYKNVPFYLTNAGYGVLVNHRDHVSFEVGTEDVDRTQFSVAGEHLEFFLFAGSDAAQILGRYTELTGRAPTVPAWSYGLWLSTSFTTEYDEATVSGFVEGMAKRDIPLSVFHFDCFWMREFNWTDFTWDPRTFPEPEAMLGRMHERGLKISAWLNPYIAQRSALFDEGLEHGYFVHRADGSVWQWDMWQAGMALVDFTNPQARAWYQDKVRTLLRQGVDAIKTDFGERIPPDLVWHDGTRPTDMHNWYSQIYNEAVFEVLEEERGAGEAVLFARSGTTGGQRMPVHWGGDCASTFAAMAQSLRGGLSLALSGYAFWSHDIGGFEGLPDADVYKRWVAFGMMSSHTRLHGSRSYRVPWIFDEAQGLSELDPTSAVSVTRKFAHLKNSLVPYLLQAGEHAAATGVPVMRPMMVEFGDDPTTYQLDRQYMLGGDLLVAPVFSASGEVQFYLPAGQWTNVLTGDVVSGGTWRTEHHEVDSIPLYLREGAVLPARRNTSEANGEFLGDLELLLGAAPSDGEASTSVTVNEPGGASASVSVTWSGGKANVSASGLDSFTVRRPGSAAIAAEGGQASL